MKNLNIIHILALCLSLVPIAVECSRASSSSASVVAAEQIQKIGYYNIKSDSAGYLYLKEGTDSYKYYLPSTTLGRWKTWSKKNLSQPEAVRVEADQRFEFYIDPEPLFDGSTVIRAKICVPYFKLKVSVNGYVVENVEIVPVEGVNITEADLDNESKLANLQMNMLQLCVQYSAFADQLQYNGTTLGRGIILDTVRQAIYDGALNPIIRAIESSQFGSRIKDSIRAIVRPYMNAYADYYVHSNPQQMIREAIQGSGVTREKQEFIISDGNRNASALLSQFGVKEVKVYDARGSFKIEWSGNPREDGIFTIDLSDASQDSVALPILTGLAQFLYTNSSPNKPIKFVAEGEKDQAHYLKTGTRLMSYGSPRQTFVSPLYASLVPGNYYLCLRWDTFLPMTEVKTGLPLGNDYLPSFEPFFDYSGDRQILGYPHTFISKGNGDLDCIDLSGITVTGMNGAIAAKISSGKWLDPVDGNRETWSSKAHHILHKSDPTLRYHMPDVPNGVIFTNNLPGELATGFTLVIQ